MTKKHAKLSRKMERVSMMPCLYFQLTLLWGNIPTNMLKVDVPHLQPGEEGNVSVGFISPLEPGKKSSFRVKSVKKT